MRYENSFDTVVSTNIAENLKVAVEFVAFFNYGKRVIHTQHFLVWIRAVPSFEACLD